MLKTERDWLKRKWIVIREEVLALQIGNAANITAARASYGYHAPGAQIAIPYDGVRDATKADFDSFRVSPKGHFPE